MALKYYGGSAKVSGVIGRTIEQSKPAWPQPKRAKPGAPNVLFIRITGPSSRSSASSTSGSRTASRRRCSAASTSNTTNDDTDYRSGTQAHVDATLALHLSLLGGVTGLGGSAFWYQQLTGDSGTGAHELDVERRLKGDLVLFKALVNL